jgi:hypothetical protein
MAERRTATMLSVDRRHSPSDLSRSDCSPIAEEPVISYTDPCRLPPRSAGIALLRIISLPDSNYSL